MDENVLVEKVCNLCGNESSVEMPRAAYDRWMNGQFIQDAWPYATADQREIVISGTHTECWNEMFGDAE